MSSDQPEQPVLSQRGDDEERPDIRDAMAAYSADGQSDDETGGDAEAGARVTPGEPLPEDDREPHGPS